MSLFANAGTPLLWGGFCVLLVGNYLIGLMEYWLIRRRYPLAIQGAAGPEPQPFHLPWNAHRRESFHSNPMIPANYLSMVIGLLLVMAAGRIEVIAEQPFRYGLPFIVGAWVASYVLTVLVEWPFVARTAMLKMGKESLQISLWVQLVSYALLAIPACLLGSMSALTNLRQVDPSEIDSPAGWVYYSNVGHVYRTRLDGSSTELAATIAPNNSGWNRVTVEPTRTGDAAKLMYRGDDDAVIDENIGLASQAAPVEFSEDEQPILGNLIFGPFSTREFREHPRVTTGFWPIEGMRINGRLYALETPALSLHWRCAVVLPDGKVVAQFGKAIVLVDHERGRVAQLATGDGGDVLLDAPPKGR